MIGLERQRQGKRVGIRTAARRVLGTYLFVSTSTIVPPESTDPSSIIGQVETGVGCLGTGLMMAKEGAEVGVTPAATTWSLATIGAGISVDSELRRGYRNIGCTAVYSSCTPIKLAWHFGDLACLGTFEPLAMASNP